MISTEQTEQLSRRRVWGDELINAANLPLGSGGFPNFRMRGGNIVARPSLSESVTTSIISYALQISFELRLRLNELIELKQGWDGDDAKPLSPRVLGKALAFLATLKKMRAQFVLPFIAPTFSGQLLLDWTSQSRTLEIETTPNGWSIVGTDIPLNGEREYCSAECSEFDPRVLHFYDWFINNELVWPAE